MQCRGNFHDPLVASSIPEIPGLYYIKNVLPNDQLDEITAELAKETRWFSVGCGKQSRKVMHYDHKYNYGSTQRQTDPAPKLPEAFADLRISLVATLEDINREIDAVAVYSSRPAAHNNRILTSEAIAREKFDQCIVNRYLPGQGIGAHIDALAYGSIVACYTFSGGAYIDFTGNRSWNEYTRREIWTEPNSLYIMTGSSRYDYKHAMVPRLTDKIGNNVIKRRERISITFRSVL